MDHACKSPRRGAPQGAGVDRPVAVVGGRGDKLDPIIKAHFTEETAKRLRRRYPQADAQEIDRLARLYMAFPKGTRNYWCEVFGISHSCLSGIVQGRTRASWHLAVELVNARPMWIALRDVLAPKALSPEARLHPEDLELVRVAA